MYQEYIDAINYVNKCILYDNRDTWWPNIVRIEGRQKFHNINGIEASSSGYCDSDDSYSDSLLRLIINKSPCEIFAYDVKFGYKMVDIIVGFLDKDKKKLKLAWNNKRVYPLIGQQNMHRPIIPPDTKWILCASLDTKNRKTVSLFGKSKNLVELEKYTPELIY